MSEDRANRGVPMPTDKRRHQPRYSISISVHHRPRGPRSVTISAHHEQIIEWRPWPRDNRYIVGEDGTIVGPAGRALKPGTHRGRKFISKIENGKHISPVVAVVVCETFHGPRPDPKMHCAHEDGDHTNDHANNLSWKTCSENQQDRRRHGTAFLGERSNWAKLTEDQVREIRARYARGELARDIAPDFGIHKNTIYKITNRQRWSHI